MNSIIILTLFKIYHFKYIQEKYNGIFSFSHLKFNYDYNISFLISKKQF